jgi:hypothetical protein
MIAGLNASELIELALLLIAVGARLEGWAAIRSHGSRRAKTRSSP